MSQMRGREVSDSLGAMSTFVRAAEARSFTDAGRQLGLSSSAIGKTVARLEARLGIRLFHRSTRSVTLTQEGKLFLESCRRIFSEMEKVELEFAQTKGAPRGKLRVSLPLVGMLMIPTLSRFMLAYPTSGKIQRWPFARSATGVDLALPMTAVATTVEALVALAEQGVGITCVPDFAVRRQVADGSLAIVLGEHIDHSGIFRALWPTSRYLAPKVRVFVDFLAEHLFPPMPPARSKSETRPGPRLR